jgi:archaellum biogenesis ATPase FlaH
MAPNIEELQAPAALRELKQWLVWKLEPNSVEGKKPIKKPYYAKSGRARGKQSTAEDVSQLVTFEEAKAAVARIGATGVGLAMVDGCPVTALDWDNCIKDGVIDPVVVEAIIGTYSEISPSGKGIRAFVAATEGNAKECCSDTVDVGFEMFNTTGFVTFTGDITAIAEVDGCHDTVAPPNAALLEVIRTRFTDRVRVKAAYEAHGEPRTDLTDKEIRKLLSVRDPDCPHPEWVAIGMALHHQTEGEGFWLWDEWSSEGGKYSGSESLQKTWESFGSYPGKPATARSLIKVAHDLGVDIGVAEADDFDVLPADKVKPLKGFNIRTQGDFSRQVRSVSWLIKDFLPHATIGMLFGESGSGKSFLAYDLCAAIARGIEWNGKRVRQGSVLYIAAEGQAGYVNRIAAYCHQHAISPDDFRIDVISDVTPDLLSKDSVIQLVRDVQHEDPYDLIVIDTFAQATSGADENSGKDMGLALNNCKTIAQVSGAMVLIVHHSGKDSSKGARGWSGLRAAADVELEVTREQNGTDRSVQVTKLKDGRDGTQVGFKLLDVVLGEDEDGDDITSCIVQYGPVPVKGAKRVKAPKGPMPRLVFSVLKELVGLETGSSVPQMDLIQAAAGQAVWDGKGKDRRSYLVGRALEGLQFGEFVRIKDGMVSLGEQ